MEFHKRLPGYAPTQLRSLSSFAHELGIEKLFVKDESWRLGLPAFKILGASWATFRELTGRQPDLTRSWSTVQELAGRIQNRERIVLYAATDGNHGRAVARVARLFGLHARIFVPQGTVQARVSGIASEGAEVIVVDGTYDDAVALAARESKEQDGVYIQDNSWDGYETIARHVVEGYSTLLWEIDDALAELHEPDPTHVVVQLGNGSFADAVIRHYTSKQSQPTLIGVEPESAVCLLESVRAGKMVKVPGPHSSIMVGMNCDSPSLISFPVIQGGIQCFVSISDERAKESMRLYGKSNIISGETGAAGLGAVLEILCHENSDARSRLGMDTHSRVLVFSTEGATDPESYKTIVG